MFALADINSFYASCEKVFRPDLRNEPVIVLSNNDGCVIARSPEAKALGIRMGQPWFQVRQMRLEKKIHVFSSNYALYHSMSQRVMAVLESLSPAVEPYSIDEMFIDLRGINHCISPEIFGHQLREQVKSWTGLTMGVGIAPTKTLAKSAQWATKQWPQFSGVVALTAENRNRTLKLLGLQPVGEVWGVGRRLTEKLNALGINTALWTGLTMGVGIAPTKTLAKSAQWATKQWPQFSGVVALTAENRNRILKLLGLQPVGEVWGVGRRLTEKLNALGINTALQLAQANTAFIRKNFSVILERTVRELNGESCISLEEAPPAKQQIVCSRSFGERITDKDAMHQAVVQYAERAAEKLRGERQYCRQVTTFVRTSPFAVKEPCYSNAAVEKLPLPTQDSRDIIAAACRALNHVWREGYRYMKAGVMLADFTPSGIAQPGLFDEIQPRKNSEKLMKTLDELNQSGKGKVWFAGRGTAPEWQMKREMLSPSYTTQWTEIPIASF
ncbi:Mutagenesis and repair protein [Shigella sonnei]|nr:translesion error-prone DNA polymerase V subunit UmuC [Shigella sonnei]CTA72431.1 Mutagenesis and repair protein [Shigella sonnei]